jgi:proteasome lid subunit RPN8/RPN11
MSDKWHVEGGAKCYDKCSHAENMAQHNIVLSKDLWHVICAMLNRFPTKEWQMMLTGEKLEAGVFCNGYIIPKQEVSMAYVENKDNITAELIAEKHIVCGIHSHVDMGVTPSHTDINDSVMSLIDYHVIVNNKHLTNGMRKAVLPCGGLSVVPCTVSVAGEVDLTKLKIEGLENITEKTYGLGQRLFEKHEYKPTTYAHNDVYWKDYTIDEERQMAGFLQRGEY